MLDKEPGLQPHLAEDTPPQESAVGQKAGLLQRVQVCKIPEGPSTQYLRLLVPKTIL